MKNTCLDNSFCCFETVRKLLCTNKFTAYPDFEQLDTGRQQSNDVTEGGRILEYPHSAKAIYNHLF